ncbi:hypothetical protein A6X21_01855 [Planctopirus hydrillae]|uniref:Uncharacterized protein n=1 Tax=Planctopirus hydrillae TaxID=1841610 RepID=A0A1C3EUB4_9PLAN|nr:hypothetical protein A6X21_01855 [Planctopirus hydrillae]
MIWLSLRNSCQSPDLFGYQDRDGNWNETSPDADISEQELPVNHSHRELENLNQVHHAIDEIVR